MASTVALTEAEAGSSPIVGSAGEAEAECAVAMREKPSRRQGPVPEPVPKSPEAQGDDRRQAPIVSHDRKKAAYAEAMGGGLQPHARHKARAGDIRGGVQPRPPAARAPPAPGLRSLPTRAYRRHPSCSRRHLRHPGELQLALGALQRGLPGAERERVSRFAACEPRASNSRMREQETLATCSRRGFCRRVKSAATAPRSA